MRGKIKNSVRTLLVVVLTMAMVMQTFCGLNFITQAAEETEYEELTFRDWGIVDGSYPADWTNKLKDSRLTSLDGTAFTGIINFNGNSDGGHAMRIGAPYREWTALQIYYRASDNALIFLDATGGGGSYGIALGEGGNSRDIKLRLTFDYDAANTTWNIGIWIDDEFKTTHAFANMSLGTCLMINGTVTLKDAITAYKLPEDYQIYTHKNFGVPYGTYTVANGTAAVSGSVSGITNFDKAILHFPKITFDGDVDLNFAGPGPWEGFKIRSASSTGELTLRSGYGQFVTSPVSMTDDIAGVDVVGGSYDLKISIQYVDDATIKMGIWFNDALYDNKYVYVDVSEKSNDKLGLYMGITSTTGGGTITLERKHAELQSLGWKDFDVNYKRFTANDYVRTTSVTNLVNTSFRGRVRFDRKSTTGNYWLGYGDPNGSWRGIRIFPDSNGVLNIKAVNPDNSYGIRESILPGDAGITSFIDTEFELGIDIEAEGDDAEIYIYVDGRKCNAEAYVWTDAVKNNCIGNGILFILGVEEDAIVAGDSGKRYYDLAKMDGGYLLSGTGSIVVNGEVRQNGDVLNIPGDYDITITDEESEYVRRVILYKAGDAHPDGEMNVADLIATKKAAEGIALQTEAGLKGADINQDSGINAEDVDLARQYLVMSNGILILCPSDGVTACQPSEAVEALTTNYNSAACKAAELKTGEDIYFRSGLTASWLSLEDVSEYQMLLATAADLSDAVTYTTTAPTFSFMNLLPDTTYYWAVRAGEYTTATRTFTTADTVRTLTVDGVSNTRDIGGYVAADGKKVKYGMVYRGGKLNDITEEGLYQMMTVLGVKTDLDLRTPGEGGAGTGSPLGSSVNYYNYNAPYYWNTTNGLLAESYKEALIGEIRTFAEEENYPIYVHCSIGRDRTGTIVFLINGLLGVSKEDLYLDYELSFLSASAGSDSANVPVMINYVNAMYDGIQSYAPEGTFADACEAFILSLGIAQSEIDTIRELMLEK